MQLILKLNFGDAWRWGVFGTQHQAILN